MNIIGIDAGSLTTKAVVLKDDGGFTFGVAESGDDAGRSALEAIRLASNGNTIDVADGCYIVATGAGGKSVAFSRQHKSINTCIARGVHRLFPSARTVVDIGAESSAALKLNARGRLSSWENQDKCASGTGIFLQQMSRIMRMSPGEMSQLSLEAGARADISNTCAVFAESEVISHIHRVPPTPMADIVAGIYASMVSRIMAMCKRVGIEKDVAVVGGVAMSRGLIGILEEELGFDVLVPEHPQMVAALGAAIIARENIEKEAAA
ncbi:MAG: acyl-CoA dehydratase activase [Chloroflexota bacterium]|nr:acyl-CoA dehydratase activase [Chloroflexota bacterium]